MTAVKLSPLPNPVPIYKKPYKIILRKKAGESK